MRLLERIRRIRLRPFDRSDYSVDSKRSVENTDALAATGGRGLDPSGGVGHPQFPPDYVKTDDGRPRH
jgi:hypothetical protein